MATASTGAIAFRISLLAAEQAVATGNITRSIVVERHIPTDKPQTSLEARRAGRLSRTGRQMRDRTYRIGAKVIEVEWETTEAEWETTEVEWETTEAEWEITEAEPAITAGESGTTEVEVEIAAAVLVAAETVEAEAGIASATGARRARVDREG